MQHAKSSLPYPQRMEFAHEMTLILYGGISHDKNIFVFTQGISVETLAIEERHQVFRPKIVLV